MLFVICTFYNFFLILCVFIYINCYFTLMKESCNEFLLCDFYLPSSFNWNNNSFIAFFLIILIFNWDYLGHWSKIIVLNMCMNNFSLSNISLDFIWAAILSLSILYYMFVLWARNEGRNKKLKYTKRRKNVEIHSDCLSVKDKYRK